MVQLWVRQHVILKNNLHHIYFSPAGSDCISISMNVTFNPGVINASVEIEIIDDNEIEVDEIFTTSMTSFQPNDVVLQDNASVTIMDNDSEK